MISIRRAALPGDPAEAFIFDTLVRSYAGVASGGRDSAPPRELAHHLFNELPDDGQRRAMNAWLRARLAEGAKLWLAFDAPPEPGSEALFLGWACASPTALHYVYVKHRVRRMRIASQLLQRAMDGAQPFRHCTMMTWPWVERWLERNGVTYLPRAHEQEQEPATHAG